MKYPKGNNCHQACPIDWRHTPNMTGDFEMDASIMNAKAKRLKTDLIHHIKADGLWNSIAPGEPGPSKTYGPRTNYQGYDGYHGDD
jgi:hypothetical protein